MNRTHFDVIVIGAGIAGLIATRDLCRRKLRVCLIEARGRVGGRMNTVIDETLSVPVELGAEFIHGRPPELLKTAAEVGCVHLDIPDRQILMQNGHISSGDDFSHLLNEISARMRKQSNKEQSFADFLEKHCRGTQWRKAREFTRNYVEGFHAARIERISLQSLIDTEDAAEKIDGDTFFRFLNGYQCFAEGVECQIDRRYVTVLLNAPVQSIQWRKGQVQVKALQDSTRKMGLTARRALITLPLGVLKATGARGAVKFDPELPREKLNAIDSLEMGTVLRVVLKFKEPILEHRNRRGSQKLADTAFFYSDGQHGEYFPTWWTTLPLRTPILTGWVGGPKAEELAQFSDKKIVDTALRSLARILSTSASALRKALARTYFHNWKTDPLTRGAYSYVPVHAHHAPGVLGKSIEGTLFFAGEATDTSGNTGTTHGAMGTGARAAREIIRSLNND